MYIKISSNKSVTLTNKPSNSQYVYYYNKKTSLPHTYIIRTQHYYYQRNNIYIKNLNINLVSNQYSIQLNSHTSFLPP